MKYLIVPAVLALAYAVPAEATVTLTQTVNIAPTTAPATSPVVFNQFDTTLGTLQSITLSFASTLIANGTAYNNSNASHSYTLTKAATAALSGNGFNFNETLASGSVSLGTIAGKTLINLAPISGSGSDSATLLSGFAPYLGTGTVSFTFASTSSFSLSTPSVLSLIASIGGAATLTYNYDLPAPPPDGVPEPASWGLMLLGFGAMGAAMRRRRTSIHFA
jgi:hypothetical protein